MAKNKKKVYVAAGIGIILVAVAAVFVLNANQILRAVGISQPAPVFTFNQSKAPGWWAAKNYNSRASVDENYEGSEPVDKLSVAGMNVFKGKEGDMATACFVMVSYYDYKADVAQLKKDKENESRVSELKNIGETTASIDVLGSTKSFTMTNYELTGKDAQNSMKGMSYGWVDVQDGYISVSGVCPTGGELNDTLPAMSALSLTR